MRGAAGNGGSYRDRPLAVKKNSSKVDRLAAMLARLGQLFFILGFNDGQTTDYRLFLRSQFEFVDTISSNRHGAAFLSFNPSSFDNIPKVKI